ncbi:MULTISPECIES: sensor histidine kinase [unclassified Paenibacillus]|uniref:sensor histidine kinase n=1 Tax=unclassified Paenibacillus TaxID=185978 RepID=UPI0009A7B209|nr:MULTISPECIES: HAMP domain-containing sensor histidine kinase [unclassified Paenibacillus]SLJ88274.1 Signal transduction histidine kinase [Paenibacillus sp. RU5A]SOC64484.1 Signal transduction histidine kinase [Paenibacillus sp. RU26A]SOC68588.1 Signal transduction histidine kinase [Paenibacillus sp. RU5M]
MIRKISLKFLLGFLLIFSFSFVILNQTVKEFIRTSNQSLITTELVGLKNNSNVYVRQAFLINHFSNNELYFGEMAEELGKNLKHASGNSVGVYTVQGELLYASDKSTFTLLEKNDLEEAIDGKTAFTIRSGENQTSVLFSYPVVIDGSKVGILRFSKDFTLMFQQSNRILDITLYITLAIFAAAFLFSYILSRHITLPLGKLTQASSEVKNGNLDIRIRFKRKDEIGRLAENFNDMVYQISQQINIIRKDRDQLIELHEQEKRFFDNITHELKTPLTSILGYAELIKANGERDPKFFEKGTNHIIEESKRLHTMVLKLLEVSRRQAYELEKVEAGSVLRAVCDSMVIRAQRYKKTITFNLENELYVMAQKDRMRQLFINLLDNAIKYSLDFSEIVVKGLHVDGKVRFIIYNPSDPIDAEQLSKLFEPFYLAHPKDSEEGSIGLGLSIVKSIVDEMEGSISIVSQDNHTTVTVEFNRLKSAKERNSHD